MARALPAELRRCLAAVKDRTASETELQTCVMAYAKHRGWLRFHPLPARAGSGRIVTLFSGDRGFPDLVLVRSGRVLFRELKRERGGIVDEDQDRWLTELAAAGVDADVWRPRDWDRIRRELF